jgi:hypothetical protein
VILLEIEPEQNTKMILTIVKDIGIPIICVELIKKRQAAIL